MRLDKAVVRHAYEATFNQMQGNLTASRAKRVATVLLLTHAEADIRSVLLALTTLMKAGAMKVHVSGVQQVHSALRLDRTALIHVSHVLLGHTITRLVRLSVLNVLQVPIQGMKWETRHSARNVLKARMLIRRACLSATSVPSV
jgi:hypothetical protein